MGKRDKKKRPVNPENEELYRKLREKIGETRIQRTTKRNKEKILDQSLQNVGIDSKKLKEDLEAIKKQGGFEINFNS